MLEYWIWLTANEALSRSCMMQLLQQFGSPQAIYGANQAELRLTQGVRQQDVENLRRFSLDDARKLLEQCNRREVHILTYQDAKYPQMLRAIEDAPLLLYYLGNLPDIDELPTIAVVGSRKASAYGLASARRIGYQLGRCGSVVVSGLARGIDTQAIEGALTAEATVIGVLGCGLDIYYPKENKTLYREISRNGCVISEYPLGTKPESWHFPIRNRIISGLCDGVLVVEAAARSGALITARLALEQGRDVFAVPGNIGIAACEGSNGLLKQGAILVESGTDVLAEYEARYPQLHAPLYERETLPLVASSVTVPQVSDAKSIDNSKTIQYIDLQDVLPQLPQEEKLILLALKDGVHTPDELGEKTALSAAEVLTALTMLEIKRYVKRLPANRFSLENK